MSIDLKAVRLRLEAQRDELNKRLDQLQGSEQKETATGGDVPGGTDNAHEWENAEIREGQMREALDELRQTEAALQRLEEGSYGLCVTCGEPIAPARLEAIPEAVFCIEHAS